MKIHNTSCVFTSINESLKALAFLMLLISLDSCSKDYYPKQFPPVQTCPDMPVVTYGGEEYPTVLIENRCWMAKNLNIGMMIGDSIDMTENNVIEKYCYENDTANCTVFGGLYQWDEVMQYKTEEGSQGICPEGWHIPTNRAFVDLVIYTDNCSGYLMDNRDTLWRDYGQSENFNLTGFSALPSGKRNLPSDVSIYYPYKFSHLYASTFFWCSKEVDDQNTLCLEFVKDYLEIEEHYFDKKYGLSIRCVKDE